MQRDGTGTTSAPLGRMASIRLLGFRGPKAPQLSELTAVGVLESHNLPSGAEGPLRTDQFEDFLTWRQERLAAELASVTVSVS